MLDAACTDPEAESGYSGRTRTYRIADHEIKQSTADRFHGCHCHAGQDLVTVRGML